MSHRGTGVTMSLADVPITEFSTAKGASSALPRVGHRGLRSNLGPILSEVHAKRGAVEVVKDGQREVVVVDHHVFTQLVDVSRDQAALRDSLPLLLSAALAGVALPSETLRGLGIVLPENTEALKRFRSDFAMTITHGESGDLLPRVRPVRAEQVEEADEEELQLVEIDD